MGTENPGRPALSKQLDELRLSLSFDLPHELRAPLHVILGCSHSLISHDPEQWPESSSILSIQTAIYESALRLQHLIENYLLYAHLRLMEVEPERSQQKAVWQHGDWLMTEAVIAPVALSKAEKVQRQADLRLELAEAVVQISERSLQKIVDELVDNALKFSESGSLIHVVTLVSKHHWMIKVTDRGRGMTTGQIASIGAFRQFEREHYEQQGSGLGLIIVRLLTQLNGGKLTIESVPKQGTTVTVAFKRSV